MKFVTRAEWGARPRGENYDPPITSNQGVKIHWLGGPHGIQWFHSQCAGDVRGVQRDHMQGNGWSDIGYSLAVCRHGYVFEGRGRNRQNAANGNQVLNRNHYAILAMTGTGRSIWGTSGGGIWDTAPTAEMKQGIRDAIVYLRQYGGAGTEIRGHRDGYNTECPGADLWAMTRDGTFESGISGPTEYITGAGETLGSVARKFDVAWSALAAANGLPMVLLEGYPFPIGTRLTIPSRGSSLDPQGGSSSSPIGSGYVPFPGTEWFKGRPNSRIIMAMGVRLVQEGCNPYRVGPGNQWSDVDRDAYTMWQRKLGYSGADADGWPGQTSWDRLMVPADGVSAGPTNYEPYPGAGFFQSNQTSSIITAMGVRLVAEGCGAYLSGPGPRWTEADRRSYTNWQRKLGYSGADADGWPGQTTWNQLRVPRQGSGPYEEGGVPGSTYEPFPGTAWFKANPNSSIVTEMGRRLITEGCSRYVSGAGPQWSEADRESYAAWQRKLGHTGADADGWPGKSSWDHLRVPRYTNQYEPYPGENWFKSNPNSAIVTNMGRRLVAEGCGLYRVGPGSQWSDTDRQSFAKWQQKLGYSGADADGWPGPTSWEKLHVPKS